MTAAATPEQDAFLRGHVWGLLATGRANGSPQLSMVAYDWDGSDLVVSCRSGAAKYVNVKRNENVMFAVPDGIDNLTIIGRAVCFDGGAERDRLTQRVRDTFGPENQWATAMLDTDIAAGLDEVRRVAIGVVPDRIHLVKPLG